MSSSVSLLPVAAKLAEAVTPVKTVQIYRRLAWRCRRRMTTGSSRSAPVAPARRSGPEPGLPIPDSGTAVERLVLMVQDPCTTSSPIGKSAPAMAMARVAALGGPPAAAAVLLVQTLVTASSSREVDLHGGNYYLAVAPGTTLPRRAGAAFDSQGRLHLAGQLQFRDHHARRRSVQTARTMPPGWRSTRPSSELLDRAGLPGASGMQRSNWPVCRARALARRTVLWNADDQGRQHGDVQSGALPRRAPRPVWSSRSTQLHQPLLARSPQVASQGRSLTSGPRWSSDARRLTSAPRPARASALSCATPRSRIFLEEGIGSSKRSPRPTSRCCHRLEGLVHRDGVRRPVDHDLVAAAVRDAGRSAAPGPLPPPHRAAARTGRAGGATAKASIRSFAEAAVMYRNHLPLLPGAASTASAAIMLALGALN